MRNTKEDNSTILYIAGVIILAILAAAVYNYGGFAAPKTASVVNSISTFTFDSNSGKVQNGYLYGSKIVASMTLTDAPAELRIQTAGTEETWGNYKIKPQYNMLIKASAHSSATSTTVEYRQSYYRNLLSQVTQTQDMKGTVFSVYTPIHIDIYADQNTIPTTLVMSKDILGKDLDGQQLITLGNGFNIQKVSNANVGALQLPSASDIVVAVAPSNADFQKAAITDYAPKTYIFDRADYDTRVKYFYDQFGTGIFNAPLNNPYLALWTGYDTFSFSGGLCGRFSSAYNNGFCKLNGWNGLGAEVAAPTYNVKFDAGTNKLILDPLQYGANTNLEIPSEYVKSLAVLRGAGTPEVTYSATNIIGQGDKLYLTVTVKNTGDADGFSIIPTPKAGKIVYSPASYTSQSIGAGETKEFKFVMTVAGQVTSIASAMESTELTVTPEHSIEARVTKTFSTAITYKVTSPTSPDVAGTPKSTPIVNPGNADTMNLSSASDGKGIYMKWYETPQATILGILVVLLIGAVYLRFRERN